MSSRSRAPRGRPRAAWRLVAILALVAATAAVLAVGSEWLQSGVLTMLPALVLVVVMLTRPYPGERAIAAWRARRARRARATAAAARPPSRLRPRADLARGGRLIASALAGRAPPLASAVG